MKFIAANSIVISRNKPRLKLSQALSSATLNQSKSHKGPKKLTPSNNPIRGHLTSDLNYMVEAVIVLTERFDETYEYPLFASI